jgi:hypothetical protein
MAGFAANLREQGCSDHELSRQAALFMDAVQMELQVVYAAAAER